MKLALALTFGMLLQATATAAPVVDPSTSSLVTSSLLPVAAVQSKGFPKPPRPPVPKSKFPKPPSPKSGFGDARNKLADKTVGKGRPKEKLDELNRRRNEERVEGDNGNRGKEPGRKSQKQLPATQGRDGESGNYTDLSPENHVRALRLELHAMKDELTLKAKKDGVKLRSLADTPESDLARFVAFKVDYYQGVCAWLETCDLSLRKGKGVAGGLRVVKAGEMTAKKDSAKDEDAKSFAVMRRRFLEYQQKSQRKAAAKEDRPLLLEFHERLADNAAALLLEE